MAISPFSGATCACDVDANKKAAMRIMDQKMATMKAEETRALDTQAGTRLTQLQQPPTSVQGLNLFA